MQPTPARIPSWRRRAAIVGIVALALTACGGGDDDTGEEAGPDTGEDTGEEASGDTVSTETSDPGEDTTANDPGVTSDVTSDEPDDTTETTAASASGGTYEPGPIGYRVVNTTDQTVDVYVRTTGLVEAFEARLGVEPGDVTEFFYPPADGPIVVTTAGAGDATCVASCDHILANVSAFDGTGDVFTLVMYDEPGQVETFQLYEEAPADVTAGNALVAADPTTGQLVPIAVDLTDADFGLNIGFDGVSGCRTSLNLGENILVGGNQTPAFAYDGDRVDVLFYANDDRECAGEPVGGPFTVEGGPGTRTMLVLTGSPGDMDAIVVPFLNQVEGDASAAADSGEGDAATAYALMAEELSSQIGLPNANAECLAPYVVDAIGLDIALVDGELIDLDAADAGTQDLAFAGIVDGVEACGIDPAVLG